jgi:hypothetical protein
LYLSCSSTKILYAFSEEKTAFYRVVQYNEVAIPLRHPSISASLSAIYGPISMSHEIMFKYLRLYLYNNSSYTCRTYKSRNSSVSKLLTIGLMTHILHLAGAGIFHFGTESRLVLGPIKPPSLFWESNHGSHCYSRHTQGFHYSSIKPHGKSTILYQQNWKWGWGGLVQY